MEAGLTFFARNGSGLARQARPPLAVRCTTTTTSAGPLKSSGRIGGRALSRGLGAWEGSLELPHDHGPSLPRNEDACWDSSGSLGSPQ